MPKVGCFRRAVFGDYMVVSDGRPPARCRTVTSSYVPSRETSSNVHDSHRVTGLRPRRAATRARQGMEPRLCQRRTSHCAASTANRKGRGPNSRRRTAAGRLPRYRPAFREPRAAVRLHTAEVHRWADRTPSNRSRRGHRRTLSRGPQSGCRDLGRNLGRRRRSRWPELRGRRRCPSHPPV